MSQNSYNQSDTFSATGNGTTVDASHAPLQNFGIMVKATGGTPTLWTVVLESSFDNSNFETVLTHASTALGLNRIVWTGASQQPSLYIRSRVSVLTLGPATNVIVQWIGMQ